MEKRRAFPCILWTAMLKYYAPVLYALRAAQNSEKKEV